MGVEQQLTDLLLDPKHAMVLIGVFSILFMLKSMAPVQATLFSERWRWAVAPLNLALSSTAIFALGLTNAQTMGLKVVIALTISACVTLSYEGLVKPVQQRLSTFFANRIKK